jgi:hypothetical protein
MPYQPSVQGFFTNSSKGSLKGILHNSNKYVSAVIAPPVRWEKLYKNLEFLLTEVKHIELSVDTRQRLESYKHAVSTTMMP